MTRNEKHLIYLSFVATYIIWGSTYLANKIAVAAVPPFLMAGGRFFVAGLILWIIQYARDRQSPSWVEIRNAGIIGFTFLSLGNGLVVWAIQYIDSGLTALLIAFEPLMVILMMWGISGIKPGKRNSFGILLGVIGTALLIGQPQFVSDQKALLGVGIIFLAIAAWGITSIYVSKIQLPKNKGKSSALQMIIGGVIMLFFSFSIGEYPQFNPELITPRIFFSWAYLVVFGSIIAFSAFNYLLHNVSPDKVATNAYVNPVVALFLGWAIGHEQIQSQSILAAIILLSGVWFINKHK